MKKLIAVSAVAALAATALSAEIGFGIWGRALWNVAANGYDSNDDSTQILSDVHQSWGGAAPRIGLTVAADTENYGFNFQIFNNGANFGQGDNAYVYAKPIDQVKLYVGKLDVNVLQGDACFGLWDWDRLGCTAGEKLIFKDYLDADGQGVSLVTTPVEGLTLGAGLPIQLTDDTDWSDPADKRDSGMVKDGSHTLSGIYAHGAAYVGAYNIEGVGTIKAALKTLAKKSVTNKDGKKEDKSQTEIAAAFDLTAIENLFVSLGARINTLKEANDQAVNAYVRFNANEQLAIHALVATQLNGEDKKVTDPKADGAFGFTGGVGVDYNLEDGIALFADVRYANGIWNNKNSDEKNDNLTFGLGVAKNYSNGSLGIAFEGSTNNGGRYDLKTNDEGQKDQFSWEIPVRFQYSF